MKDRADAVIKEINKTNTNLTYWDYISLACIVLVNAAEITPAIKPSVARIVGTFIDGSIDVANKGEGLKNGILPIQRQ